MRNSKDKTSPSKASREEDSFSETFVGKKIGKIDFGEITEIDLLGGEIEVFGGSLPGCDPTPCQCSTYYT